MEALAKIIHELPKNISNILKKSPHTNVERLKVSAHAIETV